jgi:hypothetical protein
MDIEMVVDLSHHPPMPATTPRVRGRHHQPHREAGDLLADLPRSRSTSAKRARLHEVETSVAEVVGPAGDLGPGEALVTAARPLPEPHVHVRADAGVMC